MENRKFNIFYSWQSHIDGCNNREYIKAEIDSAVAKIKSEVKLLEDSRGSKGAADIPDDILKKIASSDIFICDVTPVHTDDKQRALPNPNVMFELGYAVRSLGWNRIICVCNEAYGSVSTQPFDISKHYINTYCKKEGEENERELSLEEPIFGIISEYDDIVGKENEAVYKKHDRDIFEKMMSFVPEEELVNNIRSFKSTGVYSDFDWKCWEHIQYFQRLPENRFINQHLNDGFVKLSKTLGDIVSLVTVICNPFKQKDWMYKDPEKEYTQEELKEILQTRRYKKRDFPYPANESEENIRKYYADIDKDEKDIFELSDKVLSAYRDFRIDIKRELGI